MFRTALRTKVQSYYGRSMITKTSYCMFRTILRSIPLCKRRKANAHTVQQPLYEDKTYKVSIDLYCRCVANVVDTSGARVAIELIDGSEEGDDLTMNTKLQRFLHPLDTLAPKLPQVSPLHVLSPSLHPMMEGRRRRRRRRRGRE